VKGDALALCLAGNISAPVAVARLVLGGAAPEDIAARLAGMRGAVAEDLRRLLADRTGLERLAAAAAGIDHGATGPAALGAIRAGFDRAAAISPEASVAAYSLGDAKLLDAATAELVDWLGARGLLHGDVLDLGCGIGRIAAAVAPHVQSVLGVDVAPAMIAEGQRRHGAAARFALTDGRGLAEPLPLPPPARGGGTIQPLAPLPLREGVRGRGLAGTEAPAFDLILAVDSFPYLVQAQVAERHVADAAHLLRPGGALAIFNLSYRGPEADQADARCWADSYGFRLTCAGEQPFRIWDGRAFLLVRPAG
jgi:SAM-dependent methyltransferase